MPWTEPQETAPEPEAPPQQGETVDLASDPLAGLKLLATLVQLAQAQLQASERLIAAVEQMRDELRESNGPELCPHCDRELVGVPDEAESCPHCNGSLFEAQS